MAEKILIANRGEIAVRIMRACREMGIRSVAVYSEADKAALFPAYADECYPIGPAPASQSYLAIEKLIDAAKKCGAAAIHPGYGFLAENPEFARACEREGIKFLGPSSRVLALMGDKVAARREMTKARVPILPGTEGCVTDFQAARITADEIGYPVIIKPSGGGGGIGMTIVEKGEDLADALKSTQAIATTTFGICDVYIEKYLPDPRHIEFQILADSKGKVIHLGERECSIQRRHQKLIEESPSPAVTPAIRKEVGEIATNAARWVGYEGAGTVEFLFADGKFYFMEVNARVQVEHPVTELVTGVDIVKEQIRIGLGHPLSLKQNHIKLTGSAIECRINAEDPFNGFVPTPGKISRYIPPGGPGIRIDSGIAGSSVISPFYDPMIAKLIVWGRNRNEALARMKRALFEYVIVGTKTNTPFHKAVMENPRFMKGELGTHFIEKEIGLMGDMKRMAEEEGQLADRLSLLFHERKTIAAISAATALGGYMAAAREISHG
jgi:pyruvate carboxylase subunit A